MKKLLSNSLMAALAFGLISGSAMAHEPQYDNTKEPHESPHKAEPPTGGHANQSKPSPRLVAMPTSPARSPTRSPT
jgi:hypothetical protein